MKIIAKRIIIILIGTVITAFGIDLAIHAGFGGATLAVLWMGLSKTTGLSLGTVSILVAAAMLLFCFFYDRRQIHIGTVLYQVVYGIFVDVFAPILRYSSSRVVNFFLMLLGILIMSVGLAVYSYADFGRGSYDALMFALAEKNNWQPRIVRSCMDIVCVVLGVLLGGTFGVCTVCTILLCGFFLQFTLERLRKAFPPEKVFAKEQADADV